MDPRTFDFTLTEYDAHPIGYVRLCRTEGKARRIVMVGHVTADEGRATLDLMDAAGVPVKKFRVKVDGSAVTG